MSKIIAVTHDDRFHADDVFATAVLKKVYGDQLEIIRSRENSVIEKANIVYDVGGVYDSQNDKFDHHQSEGAGVRENGIPYASFGLVWKKWGEKLCGNKEIADKVEKLLVQIVDAGDNGFAICDYKNEDFKEYTLDRMCYAFGPTWKEEENYDESFEFIVEMAEKILEREITIARHKYEAKPLIEESYKNSEEKEILILDEYIPFSDFVEDKKEILYVISPSKKGDVWRINAVQEELFENRKDFPKEWAGLVDEEFEKVTGVIGSKFCHRKLFLAVANSRESAIKLAQIAIKN